MNLSRILFSTILLMVIFGCQQAQIKPPEPVKVEDVSLNSIAQQQRQIAHAVSLLEKGKNTTATHLINEVLVFNPEHSTALILKQQLEKKPNKIFDTRRYTQYKVKAGDSLGKIAAKWLGNSLYFVGLARLNDITNPSLLTPGLKIKIPVTSNSQIVIEEKKRSKANLAKLEKYRKDKLFVAGLRQSENMFFINRDRREQFQLQQQLLDEYAKTPRTISDRKNFIATVTNLKKKSAKSKQKKMYQGAINQQTRFMLMDQAVLLYESDEYKKASDKLASAKKINRDQLPQRIAKVENSLINKLHEQAILFYKNHTLDKALELWNLIIQLQPEHKLANTYSERARKLLKRLEQY